MIHAIKISRKQKKTTQRYANLHRSENEVRSLNSHFRAFVNELHAKQYQLIVLNLIINYFVMAVSWSIVKFYKGGEMTPRNTFLTRQRLCVITCNYFGKVIRLKTFPFLFSRENEVDSFPGKVFSPLFNLGLATAFKN